MLTLTVFVILVMLISLVFDFINGFHDAANSIAVIVTTEVLSPKQAVLWAAFFNFIAFLIFNLSVAKTIGSGLISPQIIDPYVIFSALVGAIIWNLITWYWGLPSSSSHALVGGLAGAAIMASGGFAVLQWHGVYKVLIGILLSPLLGLIIGRLMTALLSYVANIFNQAHSTRLFTTLQLVSSALLSITHGGNDAQKTMGIIAALLFSASWLHGDFYVPFWVIIICQLVISLGTMAGGWRIIKTMGTQITHLNPLRGCAAETGAACIIFIATQLGIPVSTTHTVTGSIVGVGLSEGRKAVQWYTLMKIFCFWLLTVPVVACLAGFIQWSMAFMH